MQHSLFPNRPLGIRYVLECDDALRFLKTMKDESVRLVITSPPYNIGKSYENRTSIQDYLSRQETIIAEIVRILDKQGSVCWQEYIDIGRHRLDCLTVGQLKTRLMGKPIHEPTGKIAQRPLEWA